MQRHVKFLHALTIEGQMIAKGHVMTAPPEQLLEMATDGFKHPIHGQVFELTGPDFRYDRTSRQYVEVPQPSEPLSAPPKAIEQRPAPATEPELPQDGRPEPEPTPTEPPAKNGKKGTSNEV